MIPFGPLFQYTRLMARRPLERPDDLLDRLAEGLLDHGAYALRWLDSPSGSDAQATDSLLQAGYVSLQPQGYRLTPRGLHRIEEKALHELFLPLLRASSGQHPALSGQEGDPDLETRPYAPGDRTDRLDLGETLGNALRRSPLPWKLPCFLNTSDFVVRCPEPQAGCATVVLLDQSGSMALRGKYTEAKRLALGLRALVRRVYPGDTLDVVGFATRARRLVGEDLVLSSPCLTGLLEDRGPRRFPVDAPWGSMPEQFTNIQAGLRLAHQLLAQRRGTNRQILCITDGEPTAHLEGREVVLAYPPTEVTARATLKEAARMARQTPMSVLALGEEPPGPELQNFLARLVRQIRGRAVYCTPGRLARRVLDCFRDGRRSSAVLG